jgi:phage FluMu protein Com
MQKSTAGSVFGRLEGGRRQMINISCPACGKNLHTKDEYAGKRIKCPRCSETIRIPAFGQPATKKISTAEPTQTAHTLSPARSKKGSIRSASDSSGEFMASLRTPGSDRNRVVLYTILGISLFVLILGTVGVTLWASGALLKTNSPQQANPQGSNANPLGSKPSEQPAAPSAQSQPNLEMPKAKPAVQISGDVFLTTEAGDIKKAAGLTIYLTPVTPELRDSLKSNLPKLVQIENDFKAFRYQAIKKYPYVLDELPDSAKNKARNEAIDKEVDEYQKAYYTPQADPLMNALKFAVEKGRYTTIADSDGKFRLDVAPGAYVLWTEELSVLRERLRWCKAIDVGDNASPMVLDQKSAIRGEQITIGGSYIATNGVYMYDLLRQFALELGIK